MGSLNDMERPVIGKLANEIRDEITEKLENRLNYLKSKELELKLKNESIDVTIPGRRKEIGKKSRQYIEKYHSKKTAYLMFSNIYSKIWNGENIDLINYFHPKIGKFNNDFLINERGANK